MPHHDAQHYRNRAKQLEAEAAKRTDEVARDVLLNVAQQCEARARDLELRGPLNVPGWDDPRAA